MRWRKNLNFKKLEFFDFFKIKNVPQQSLIKIKVELISCMITTLCPELVLQHIYAFIVGVKMPTSE